MASVDGKPLWLLVVTFDSWNNLTLWILSLAGLIYLLFVRMILKIVICISCKLMPII